MALCPGLPGWAGTRRNTHPSTHPDHHPIFISFLHLPRSIASSLFKLPAWQSFCTTSFHVLFGLPLGLEPSTSYSIHFFTQSVSSFHSTCLYHCNLFCCDIGIIYLLLVFLSTPCLDITRAFQRAIDEVRTLPVTTPKGSSKSELFLFWIKLNFNWMKSATKFLWQKSYNSKVVVQSFPYLTVHRLQRETNPLT